MTIPAVLHPSTVQLVRDHLTGELVDVPVGRRWPNPAPSRFVTVSRFGGVAPTPVSDLAQIGVEVSAGDPDATEDLAQQVRQAVHALAGTTVDGVTVYFVRDVSGPQDLPHVSGRPRFAFTVEMHVRTAP